MATNTEAPTRRLPADQAEPPRRKSRGTKQLGVQPQQTTTSLAFSGVPSLRQHERKVARAQSLHAHFSAAQPRRTSAKIMRFAVVLMLHRQQLKAEMRLAEARMRGLHEQARQKAGATDLHLSTVPEPRTPVIASVEDIPGALAECEQAKIELRQRLEALKHEQKSLDPTLNTDEQRKWLRDEIARCSEGLELFDAALREGQKAHADFSHPDKIVDADGLAKAQGDLSTWSQRGNLEHGQRVEQHSRTSLETELREVNRERGSHSKSVTLPDDELQSHLVNATIDLEAHKAGKGQVLDVRLSPADQHAEDQEALHLHSKGRKVGVPYSHEQVEEMLIAAKAAGTTRQHSPGRIEVAVLADLQRGKDGVLRVDADSARNPADAEGEWAKAADAKAAATAAAEQKAAEAEAKRQAADEARKAANAPAEPRGTVRLDDRKGVNCLVTVMNADVDGKGSKLLDVQVDARDGRGSRQTNAHLVDDQAYGHRIRYSASQFEAIQQAAGHNYEPVLDAEGKEIGRTYGVKADLMTSSKANGLILNSKTVQGSSFKVEPDSLEEQAVSMGKAQRSADAAWAREFGRGPDEAESETSGPEKDDEPQPGE